MSTRPNQNDRDYLMRRIADCRRMAAKSAEPGVAAVHRRMAEEYERRASAC